MGPFFYSDMKRKFTELRKSVKASQTERCASLLEVTEDISMYFERLDRRHIRGLQHQDGDENNSAKFAHYLSYVAALVTIELIHSH